MADAAVNDVDAGLAGALATLQGLLTSGETLEAWAAQRRIYALTHRRLCIAATSGRFISLTRRLLGGYESTDIRWQDLRETHISAGVLAADLTLVAQISSDLISLTRRLLGGYESADIRWQDLRETHISAGILAADLTLVAQSSADLNIAAEPSRMLRFEGLNKDQAQAMYRICQQHDQVWREKRRVRELEELRAKSGGVQISGASYPGGGDAAAGAESDPARRLRQAREMLEAKLISDAEFESIKAKIVSGL